MPLEHKQNAAAPWAPPAHGVEREWTSRHLGYTVQCWCGKDYFSSLSINAARRSHRRHLAAKGID